jgi:hypothetical protein
MASLLVKSVLSVLGWRVDAHLVRTVAGTIASVGALAMIGKRDKSATLQRANACPLARTVRRVAVELVAGACNVAQRCLL